LALLRTHPRAQRLGSVLLRPDDERPFNPSRETRNILARAGQMGSAVLRGRGICPGPKWGLCLANGVCMSEGD
jgi:hypothetical protein